MRRALSIFVLVAIAITLFLVLRERKRQFIAAQIELLQSNDPEQASQARKALQRIGPSAVRPVCALLEHEDEEVRARAALTLANIGHPAASGPLMAAAKRGDFPAAHALEFMKHPRATKARASLNCRMGNRALEELERRLPTGGARPTDPWVRVSAPRRPFQVPGRSVIQWPGGGDAPAWLASQPHQVERWYRPALDNADLPEAALGCARLYMVCGDHARAAGMYARALELAPDNQAARSGRAQADRLVRLKQSMSSVVGRRVRLRAIFTHPSWRDGDATYYVVIAAGGPSGIAIRYPTPKSILFRSSAQGPEKAGEGIPAFTTAERAAAGQRLRAHTGIVERGPGQSALLVVIRGLAPWQPSNNAHDVVLYRPSPAGLVKVLQKPSSEMPWVGDLDDDGDAEILTWRRTSWEPPGGPARPWPIVRTLVDGRYEVRTEQFPSVFPDVLRELTKWEPAFPLDPKLPDHVGRAYEILGQTESAIAAYQRAEQKYRATADRAQKKGQAQQARLHREAAEAVKQRRLRLESKGGTG